MVDVHVPLASDYEVHDGHTIYLMKSELKANNNKFYIVQVLKRKRDNRFFSFTRYGRVGSTGNKDLQSYANVDAAIKYYIKQVR